MMPAHIHKIPMPARWVFRLLLPRSDFLYLMGDYTEIYNRIAREKGKGHADLWIARQACRSIPKYLSDALYWRLIMLTNTIKVMFRGFKRHKGFTFINFAGLAIGLSVTLIITFYIMDDLKYDRFHPNADRIFRVLSVGVKRGTKNSITSGPLVQAFKRSLPEVQYATRVTQAGRIRVGPEGTDFRNADEGSILQVDCILADTDFFNVFDFKILEGNSGEALATPGSVFLTPQTAQALFGDDNPLGKPVAVHRIENAHVAGIVEAPPQTSHIRFGMVAALIPSQNPVWWDNWENLTLNGYVRLQINADRQATQEKMVELASKSEFPQIFEPRIQPLLDIHLGSADHSYDSLNAGKNDIVVVYTMGVIGILVLLVACINFINLSTSRAGMRAREVGMRKVAGSSQSQLITQFLGESVLTTILTFLGAVLVVQNSLPYLSSILDKQLSLSLTRDLIPLIALFLTAVFIGVLSGVYPSFVLSSFKPVHVLRGDFKTGRNNAILRRVLVVFQFGVTTALLVGVLVILSQIRYLRSMDMGYNRDQVLVLVNGVRQNNALNGGMDLSLIPIENIERIEIVRGGASALYGADAFGGVVNVITKKAAGSRFKITLENGSYIPREYVSGYGGGTTENPADPLDLLDSQKIGLAFSRGGETLSFVTTGSITRADNGFIYNDLNNENRKRSTRYELWKVK